MSNEKFTPVEWRVEDYNEWDIAGVFIVDKEGEPIAKMCERFVKIPMSGSNFTQLVEAKEEQEANASLIEAAPEMYRNNEQTLTELEQIIPAMLAVCADCHNRNCKVCQFAKVLKTASEMERRIEQVQKKARGEQ